MMEEEDEDGEEEEGEGKVVDKVRRTDGRGSGDTDREGRGAVHVQLCGGSQCQCLHYYSTPCCTSYHSPAGRIPTTTLKPAFMSVGCEINLH